MVVLFADQRCRLWQVLTPLVIVIITPEIIKILPFLSSSLVLARLYPKTNPYTFSQELITMDIEAKVCAGC